MKKLVLAVSLLVILVAGVIAVTYMQSEIPVTYDGRGTDVYALQQDPESYDVSDPDGAASIIVQENLAKTQAVTPRHILDTGWISAATTPWARASYCSSP